MAAFRVGVVLVRWQQPAPTGHPPAWYQGFYGTPAAPGVAGYWSRQSGGQAVFEGRVVPWFDLQASVASLLSGVLVDRTKLGNAALAQAVLAGFDPSGLDAFVVVPDVQLPAGLRLDAGATSLGVTIPVPVGAITVAGPAAVIPVGADFDFAAHEVGHTLGLDHSFGPPDFHLPDTWPGEYGHYSCIMSAQTYGDASPQFDVAPAPGLDRELRSRGPGLNGATRVARGWAQAIEQDLEPGLRQAFSIRSLGSPADGQGPTAIRLTKSPAETYAVTFRSPADEDDRGLICPLVVVEALKGSSADAAHPGTNSATYLGEIQRPDPVPFVGPGFKVELVFVSDDQHWAIVRVTEGQFPPVSPSARPTFVYAVEPDGTLQWYRHDGRDNARHAWTGPKQVGTSWQGFTAVVSDGTGVLYALRPDGALLWYRHDGRYDGSFAWAGPSQVGTGWQGFRRVFAGDIGLLYAVRPDGALLWYRHDGRTDGSAAWTGPKQIGTGWQDFWAVFGMDDGLIYAIRDDGALLWYRHDGRADGTVAWTGPRQVGSDWRRFKQVFPGPAGVIYAVEPDGSLLWYRHDGRADGSFAWSGPKQVGNGWQGFTRLICR